MYVVQWCSVILNELSNIQQLSEVSDMDDLSVELRDIHDPIRLSQNIGV